MVYWSVLVFRDHGGSEGMSQSRRRPKIPSHGSQYPPLHMAVFVHKIQRKIDEGTPAIITALLEVGADIEARNVDGATPLL